MWTYSAIRSAPRFWLLAPIAAAVSLFASMVQAVVDRSNPEIATVLHDKHYICEAKRSTTVILLAALSPRHALVAS